MVTIIPVQFEEDDPFRVLFNEDDRFNVEFEEDEPFNVVFDEHDQFDVGFENLTLIERPAEVDLYTGDYKITPQAHTETVIPTRDKLMTDDVTVLSVPYFETSNMTGKTVYIASEV